MIIFSIGGVRSGCVVAYAQKWSDPQINPCGRKTALAETTPKQSDRTSVARRGTPQENISIPPVRTAVKIVYRHSDSLQFGPNMVLVKYSHRPTYDHDGLQLRSGSQAARANSANAGATQRCQLESLVFAQRAGPIKAPADRWLYGNPRFRELASPRWPETNAEDIHAEDEHAARQT